MNSKQILFSLLTSIILIIGIILIPQPVNNSVIQKFIYLVSKIPAINFLELLGYLLVSISVSFFYIMVFRHNKSFNESFESKNFFLFITFVLATIMGLYCLNNLSIETVNNISVIVVAIFGISKFSLYIYSKINK